jgi:hypothetical protein
MPTETAETITTKAPIEAKTPRVVVECGSWETAVWTIFALSRIVAAARHSIAKTYWSDARSAATAATSRAMIHGGLLPAKPTHRLSRSINRSAYHWRANSILLRPVEHVPLRWMILKSSGV